MPSQEELVFLYEVEQLSFADLRKKFEVSASTIHKWLKIHGIKARHTPPATKVVNGRTLRRCSGHLHNGRYIPPENFIHQTGHAGNTSPRCKKCNGKPSLIPLTDQHRAWIESIIRRLGTYESARRLEVSHDALKCWRFVPRLLDTRKPQRFILSTNLAKIVQLMLELKITREVRHKDSIRHGASMRGKPERPVKVKSDLYVPTSDTENEMRQRYRQENAEQEKETAHNYKERRNKLSRERRAKGRKKRQKTKAA